MIEGYSPQMMDKIRSWGTLITEGEFKDEVVVNRSGRALVDGRWRRWSKGDYVDAFLLLLGEEIDE